MTTQYELLRAKIEILRFVFKKTATGMRKASRQRQEKEYANLADIAKNISDRPLPEEDLPSFYENMKEELEQLTKLLQSMYKCFGVDSLNEISLLQKEILAILDQEVSLSELQRSLDNIEQQAV